MPERWSRYVTLMLLVGGMATATVLVGQKQNIFSQASFSFTPPPSLSLPRSVKSQILFYRLSRLYPDAEKQDIDLPQAGISGQAYLARDTTGSVPKTFIFIRLDNLAPPTGRTLRLWLVNSKANLFSPAAIAESLSTDNGPVSYTVFVRDGDLSAYDSLTLSFDLSPDVSIPSLPIIDLRL